MYFDLFLPFPQERESINISKSKNKGKGKAAASVPTTGNTASSRPPSCWDGLEVEDKETFAERMALAGHLGYNVVGCTIARDPEIHVRPSPFASAPFPLLDPRSDSADGSSGSTASGLAGPSRNPMLVQVSRYHFRLDDPKTHPLLANNTAALRNYDIISCQPTNEKALQLACTDMSNPGPNQISIITLPLHERPYHFRLNRKQIKQAQRNGVVFELLYAAGLFPGPSVPPDAARRYRQNWLTNAREVIRVTGGKGVILSSGPGGSRESMRGPADLVNLATTLGMPANVAKDCLSLNAKMVLLRAQARRTFKAVLSTPRMMPPLGESIDITELGAAGDAQHPGSTEAEEGRKRLAKADAESDRPAKKIKTPVRPTALT